MKISQLKEESARVESNCTWATGGNENLSDIGGSDEPVLYSRSSSTNKPPSWSKGERVYRATTASIMLSRSDRGTRAIEREDGKLRAQGESKFFVADCGIG
jgi:hypothetical protein